MEGRGRSCAMTPWSSSAQVLVAASGEVADCIHMVTTRLKNKVGVEPAKNCSFSNLHLRLSPKTRPLQPFSRNKHDKKDCLSLVYGHFLLHNNCREGWIYFIQKAQICHIISVNYLLNILTCCDVCFLRSEILALMSLIKYYPVELQLMHEVGCHSCFQNQLFTSRWLRPSFIDVCDSSQDWEVSSCLLSEAHRRLTKIKASSSLICDFTIYHFSLQQLI